MAIYKEEAKTMQQGVIKTLDESAIGMLFDMAQKYQYSYPVKSTTRELLCNGIDSVLEKNIARKILSGEAKVSDYYEDMEGDIYNDSKFDPSYYDLKWLNPEDSVTLQYVEGDMMQKDKVVFSDTGVGLGGRRLEKYFNLGFSTKRLSKLPIGKFGVGAKSAFSIGLEYYTVENCYNGKKFQFQVYDRSVFSTTPAFNLETGEENPYILFAAGTADEHKVYYLNTTEYNRLTISLDAKKHHKKQYTDAVKEQMLYFGDLEFSIINPNGDKEVINHKADILYEDQYIILSENQYFRQPHLLLNKVSYGLIDWSELELEEKRGNIGIKVTPDEVDVNPSRESVIWTEKTKEKILGRYREVQQVANNFINEELKETDFIKWWRKCTESTSILADNTTLGRLSKVVDLSNIQYVYQPFPQVKHERDGLKGFIAKFVEYGIKVLRATGEEQRYIKRTERTDKGWHFNAPVYLMGKEEGASNRKDKYLLHLHPKGFLVIYKPAITEEEMKTLYTEEQYELLKKSPGTGVMRNELWKFIEASECTANYAEVVVPEDFKSDSVKDEEPEEELTEEEVKEEQIRNLSSAERRKLEGKTIVMTPVMYSTLSYNGKQRDAYHMSKTEIQFSDINNWADKKQLVYYGNNADLGLLLFVAHLTRPVNADESTTGCKRSYAEDYIEWQKSKYYRLNKDFIERTYHCSIGYDAFHFYDAPVVLLKVAENNNKYYRDFKHVEEFFYSIKNKTITVSNLLVQWNTARIIKNKLSEAAFLYNFSRIHPVYSKMYRELCSFINKHYREIGKYVDDGIEGLDGSTYNHMLSHLDTIQRFQEFVAANNDPAAISQLAMQLFKNPSLQDGMAVDPEIMSKLTQVLEYSTACGTLLNHIPDFTGYVCTGKPGPQTSLFNRVDMEPGDKLVYETKEYLLTCNVPEYQWNQEITVADMQEELAIQEQL